MYCVVIWLLLNPFFVSVVSDALVFLWCRKSNLFYSGVGSLPCVLMPVCGECHACLQLCIFQSQRCIRLEPHWELRNMDWCVFMLNWNVVHVCPQLVFSVSGLFWAVRISQLHMQGNLCCLATRLLSNCCLATMLYSSQAELQWLA